MMLGCMVLLLVVLVWVMVRVGMGGLGGLGRVVVMGMPLVRLSCPLVAGAS